MKHIIYDFLIESGFTPQVASYLNMLALLLLLLVVALILDFIFTLIFRRISNVVATRTKTNFDDILIDNKLPTYAAHIVPLLLVYEAVPYIFTDFDYVSNLAEKSIRILGILLSLYIIKSFLLSIRNYLKTIDRYKNKPIYSYIQVFMIVAWLLAIFSIFATITGVSFWKFITGLGAASAIIILVFRDSILGFVASIQVTVNDMVRIGDWITFEKYGADGDVIEITLATVKVQNWDKTITTIPTYALISDSFKNWRGMTASGGRRIKRSVIIKASTIKFLTPIEIQKLKDIQLITDYLEQRDEIINTHNEQNQINKEALINGRNMTNFGVFRKYLQTYIENHSAIHKDMTYMVRQLEQTPHGIPLEIYCFSKDQRWVNYEYIMGDIFDHVLASVKFFDLEVYEYHTTTDQLK
ncbi:mechanosensitive ion channel family protein [Nonlabens tegetincola]|uniref:mechanosensitive ion channel family protein n=1 Tax=Nonlabens tegetincola TaxID=323273 RepID=UPI000CF4773D|nr:mechanosensitive ion channel domain-containing protein [Nonlabens tegetincola]PQJ14081.1 mechanosensitive ion channel protein MscS [Nonlabens tegetincola]